MPHFGRKSRKYDLSGENLKITPFCAKITKIRHFGQKFRKYPILGKKNFPCWGENTSFWPKMLLFGRKSRKYPIVGENAPFCAEISKIPPLCAKIPKRPHFIQIYFLMINRVSLHVFQHFYSAPSYDTYLTTYIGPRLLGPKLGAAALNRASLCSELGIRHSEYISDFASGAKHAVLKLLFQKTSTVER